MQGPVLQMAAVQRIFPALRRRQKNLRISAPDWGQPLPRGAFFLGAHLVLPPQEKLPTGAETRRSGLLLSQSAGNPTEGSTSTKIGSVQSAAPKRQSPIPSPPTRRKGHRPKIGRAHV